MPIYMLGKVRTLSEWANALLSKKRDRIEWMDGYPLTVMTFSFCTQFKMLRNALTSLILTSP